MKKGFVELHVNEELQHSWNDFCVQYAEKLGWSSHQFPNTVIDTGQKPGITWLSRDIYQPSSFKADFITVNSVEDQKKLGGIDDRFYDERKIQPHVEIPPLWDSKYNNFAATANLGIEQQQHICMGHSAFLFGDSKAVASYHTMINMVHYPCHVAIYAGKQLIVRKGHCLVTKAQFDGEPVVLFFERILIESGAEINCRADTSIYAGELVQIDSDGVPVPLDKLKSSQPVMIRSIGEDGKTALPGKLGIDGAQGRTGIPAQDGHMFCDIKAGSGSNGTHGSPGVNGGNGSLGKDGFYITLKIGQLSASLLLANYGGNGSDGAVGGHGGNGGNGGLGGLRSAYCEAGVQGEGGTGGSGGNGGNGGSVGDGRNIYITCWQQNDGAVLAVAESTQQAGKGGSVGLGGGGGLPSGQGGVNGESGKRGQQGRLGLVFNNFQLLRPMKNSK